MVYTKQTRRRGGSRAVAAGLGARGGIGERDNAISSCASRHSRSARNSPRDSTCAPMVESSQPTLVEDSSMEGSYEEYTPRTPTREDLQEYITTLERENVELKTELSRVQVEKAEVRGLLNNLQGENAKLGGELNKVLAEYDELFKINHTMAWKCRAIEWERRIVARSWKRRLGDRVRYYRGAASEYVGLIREYFSSWAHQYRHGPDLGFIWNCRPDNTYEDFVRIIHYPSDMT